MTTISFFITLATVSSSALKRVQMDYSLGSTKARSPSFLSSFSKNGYPLNLIILSEMPPPPNWSLTALVTSMTICDQSSQRKIVKAQRRYAPWLVKCT